MRVWPCKTEKQRDKLAATFSALCKVWAQNLAVDCWNIEMHMEFGLDVDQGHREFLEGTSGGITVPNPSYERAIIYLCILDQDVSWTQRELEELAAHEVVHILLSPITNTFSGKGDDFLRDRTVESTVTRTARALLGRFS